MWYDYKDPEGEDDEDEEDEGQQEIVIHYVPWFPIIKTRILWNLMLSALEERDYIMPPVILQALKKCKTYEDLESFLTNCGIINAEKYIDDTVAQYYKENPTKA